MQLHDKIKALRLRNHKTQQEIADMLCVTRATIYNFEIGRRKPQIELLEKLAAIYGVDLNYFAARPITANDLMEIVNRAEPYLTIQTYQRKRKIRSTTIL